jgi:hypothetical protein
MPITFELPQLGLRVGPYEEDGVLEGDRLVGRRVDHEERHPFFPQACGVLAGPHCPGVEA